MINVIKKIFMDKTFVSTLVLAVIALMFGQASIYDIDGKTIIALLALIMLVSVYERLNILKYVANTIVLRYKSTRGIIFAMLLFSFVGSMLFTNDVAILTLVPIFFKISQQINIRKVIPITLLTIYANLGSALTPFGNPQNLYIVSFYHLKVMDFFTMSLPLGLIAFLSLVGVSLLYPATKIEGIVVEKIAINGHKLKILLIATIIVLLGILSVISIWCSLIASIVVGLMVDRKVFAEVDYGIILTFINFFIVVGAISRINVIGSLISATTKTQVGTFIAGILTSQFISNVPAAVLLSKFTDNYYGLYIGVTVGGLGTIIASLANLLAFRQYNIFSFDNGNEKFLKTFTVLNISYLLLFMLLGWVIII